MWVGRSKEIAQNQNSLKTIITKNDNDLKKKLNKNSQAGKHPHFHAFNFKVVRLTQVKPTK